MPAEGQRRRSAVQALAVAKASRPAKSSKTGPKPKLERRAEAAIRAVTRYVKNRDEKTAIRMLAIEGMSAEIVAAWIKAGMAIAAQLLDAGEIEPSVFLKEFRELVGEARLLVADQSKGVTAGIYDAAPAVQVIFGGPMSQPTLADGPGDILEIG